MNMFYSYPINKTHHICTLIAGVLIAIIAGLLPINLIIARFNIGILFGVDLVPR